MKYTFTLDNLNCAHCAGKIEKKLAETEGYENVNFNFANKKLVLESAKNVTAEEIQAVCDSIEDGVEVIDNTKRKNLKQYTFTLDNLNCAHCAGKIEKKLAETDSYENVNFNFANKKLVLESENTVTAQEIQTVCDSIEYGVEVIDNNVKENTTAPEIAKSAKKDKKVEMKNELISIIIAAVLGVAAFGLELTVFGDAEFGSVGSFVLLGLSLVATVLSGWRTFIKGVKSVFKLQIDETTLLTIAVIAAFALGEFVEAAMVTILFAVGEIVEEKAVSASRSDIAKLAQIRPDNATVLINGKEVVKAAEDVAIGSTIVVKPHERVPLDGVISMGSTTLDASALTGESVPVDAEVGSEVMSGMINGNSLIEIKTTKEFGDSTAARIIKLVEDAAATKGQSEKFISRFATVYTPIIILISIIVAIVPPIVGLGSFSTWIYRALVCLVASCPCAIVISVPLSYYSGLGASSKISVLIKGGKYIEALAKADAFVFDKTGTLTTGELSVNKIFAYGNHNSSEIISLAAACERYSSHPIAMAIKAKAGSENLPELSDYSEKAGQGVTAVYNGKSLVCGGTKILTDKQKANAEKTASVYVIYDGELIGAISVSDTLRPEAKSVIAELRELGVKDSVMLTGDKKENAMDIANELKLDSYSAELMPSDKLEKLVDIKKTHKSVCFIGDGINDAPVLTASDCGFAMGFGSEAAIEAADAVLAAGNLKQLPTSIRIAKKVVATVKTNITFALGVKTIVIILAILGIAPMWLSVIADTGVSVLCVLYAARLLHIVDKK
ncbi:heavy metal translocating P-type ATPase [Ruminococcus sp.]|uniref:heavy metal translocating P-type ATPase n=1 Tax=Ruminococcus sp. TaxID=41978 RepID=UPI00386C9FE6